MIGAGVPGSGSDVPRSERLNLEALVSDLYQRHRERYVVGHLVGAYAMIVALGVLGGAVGARFSGQRVGRGALSTLAIELALALPIAWATRARRSDIELMKRWTAPGGGQDEALRIRVADVAMNFSRRLAIAIVWRVLLFVPATAVVVFSYRHGRFQPTLVVAVAIGAASIITYGGLLGYFGGELALRPLRAELGSLIDRGEFGALSFVSMRLKLLAGSALVLFFVSFISVALAAPPVPGAATVAKLLLISLLAAPALGLLVMIPLMRSILAPVRDLISGTNRIARGDLNVQAPVTTSDELGELAISFNEMVVGLREREVLREQNADLVQELTASRARIVTAADAARRQIERDLHDGAQQRLVLVDLKLALAERLLDSDPDAAKAAHTELRHDLEHALRELRDLAHGIYPAVLENEGLTAALGEATTGAAIPVELRSNGISRYPPQIEAAIYFCCLEALQNAAKHAGQGARAEVRLRDSDGRLRFDVVDNGAGFEPAAAAASSGLQNMTDRIGALGGTLHIQSTPGAGTTITGSIPI